MIEIELPDGTIAEFPEGTTTEQIQAALAQAFPKPEGRNDGWSGPTDAEIATRNASVDQGIKNAATSGAPYSAALGLADGFSFGSADELAGFVGGNAARDDMRAASDRARENNPAAYYTGQIGGAAGTSVAGAGAAGIKLGGAGLKAGMAQGAKIGATEGAIWEFLNAQGGLGNRLKAGGKGAVIGAPLGAAAPLVVAGVSKGARTVGDLLGGGLDAVTGKANQGRAGRAVMATVDRSGQSIDDVQARIARAAQDGQPEFRLMDATGQAGRDRANGITRAGREGAEELVTFLENRQAGQPDRLGNFIDDAWGTKGTTAEMTKSGLTKARDDAADIAYDAARANAGPVNINSAVESIDDALRSNVSLDGGLTGLTDTATGKRLANIKNQLATGDYQAINFDDVLETKQELYRAMQVMKQKGGVPPQISKVYSQLDAALEGSSDMYRTANDGFREASGVIKSVDDGAMMAKRGNDVDNIAKFGAKTPEEQGAARIGYGNDLIEAVRNNKAPTANKARALRSPKMDAEAAAMTVDPALYGRRLDNETAMWRTQDTALQGSRTVNNAQAVGDVGAIADVGRAASSALSGNFGNALNTIGARVGAAAGGQNEATRALIAKMLMSDNPQQALAQALRSQTINAGTKRALESMVRGMGREQIPKL